MRIDFKFSNNIIFNKTKITEKHKNTKTQLHRAADQKEEFRKTHEAQQKQIQFLSDQLHNLEDAVKRKKDEIKEKEKEIQDYQEMLDKQQIEV